MKGFHSEEELQNYLQKGDFYQADFTDDRKGYLLICEVEGDTTYTLYTDRELETYMRDNSYFGEGDFVVKLANRIGKPCVINLKEFYVGGDYLDEKWCIIARGRYWRDGFDVALE